MEKLPGDPVPVFPLPGTVLFPHVLLPLHVFELRYRTMVRDALSGGRHLALALLQPGWERDYKGSPAFHATGCLARIERVEWLPNDCYDLEVCGVARVRFAGVVKEFPYRAARLEPYPEHPYPEDDPLVELERQALHQAWKRLLARRAPASAHAVPPDAPGDVPLVALANRVCALLDLAPAEKLALLETDSVLERSQRARARIERLLLGGDGPARDTRGGAWN